MANQDVLRQKLGDRIHVPNYLVLVTKSVRDLDEMLVQSRNLKMKGTRIMALGKKIILIGTNYYLQISLCYHHFKDIEQNNFEIIYFYESILIR